MSQNPNPIHPDLAGRLQRMIEAERGADARVINFGVMEDGHAGLTFGFDVVDTAGAALGAYVLKMAPAGVARRGNTDVYKQAPLLRALRKAGLPVPEIPWASPEEDQLGTPFIVMEKMPGRVFLVWEPHDSFSRDPVQLRDIWVQAARLLAQVHRIDWRQAVPQWEEPRPLSDELDRWTKVLRHAEDPDWFAAGSRLGTLLTARMPAEAPIGVIHGDFQPGNILYENGKAGGLIDWELASIGSQGLDLGWVLMMSDHLAWHPNWQPVAPVSAADLIEAYRGAGGPAFLNLDWYQALAHYRLGAIACLNVKLHRTGKRQDPLWDRFAPSIPLLFARGIALAERAHHPEGNA
ncbi:MAG: phosphotransferase family protein [Xanthobacteraceae bacterium]|nr:phosphotransferase family protein [Xanthobacteraceae bacterium]